MTGGRLPTGYNPYETLTSDTPSSVVWTTIQGRTANFFGADGVTRTIAHQAVPGVGPPIPGEDTVEESGSILVDETVNGVVVLKGVGGTYSYVRTGGEIAKMAIQYQSTVGGVPQTVSLVYTMNFDALDAGTLCRFSGCIWDVRREQIHSQLRTWALGMAVASGDKIRFLSPLFFSG